MYVISEICKYFVIIAVYFDSTIECRCITFFHFKKLSKKCHCIELNIVYF